jgi:tetratricopeptide (TPR) repeat protein
MSADSILGLAYHKLGVFHYNEDNYTAANQAWNKAIDIRSSLFAPNHIDIVKGYRNLGNSYLNENRFAEAKDAIQKGIDLHESRIEKDSILIAKLLNFRAGPINSWNQIDTCYLPVE